MPVAAEQFAHRRAGAGSAQQLLACRPLSSPPPNSPQPLSQLGASQPQAGSAGQAGVSQQAVSQPWPRLPIMRSSRSKPKLWVVIRQPKAKLNDQFGAEKTPLKVDVGSESAPVIEIDLGTNTVTKKEQ